MGNTSAAISNSLHNQKTMENQTGQVMKFVILISMAASGLGLCVYQESGDPLACKQSVFKSEFTGKSPAIAQKAPISGSPRRLLARFNASLETEKDLPPAVWNLNGGGLGAEYCASDCNKSCQLSSLNVINPATQIAQQWMVSTKIAEQTSLSQSKIVSIQLISLILHGKSVHFHHLHSLSPKATENQIRYLPHMLHPAKQTKPFPQQYSRQPTER
ncbi:hypothetical protein D5086_029684 [Populus alba]|uniref:Uncharacterized protein n=1 Tax=Populus alba TaxID=43335 RepID=A0ACC4AUZ2_POPAL